MMWPQITVQQEFHAFPETVDMIVFRPLVLSLRISESDKEGEEQHEEEEEERGRERINKQQWRTGDEGTESTTGTGTDANIVAAAVSPPPLLSLDYPNIDWSSSGGSNSTLSPDKNSSSSSSGRHIYHFLGASHMRYSASFILKLFKNYDADQRKLEHINADNFRYTGWDESHALPYSDNCDTDDFNSSFDRLTFVMQSGAWDLQKNPLQVFIHNGTKSDEILGKLRDILTRKHLPCLGSRGLVHVIWVLAVPYPLCFDANDAHCNGLRHFSNNNALSAFNAHLIEGLLDIQRAILAQYNEYQRKYGADNVDDPASMASSASRPPPPVKLSIVDSYSIIKPRLILSNDFEVLCSMHYLCIEEINGEYRNIITQGGVAVVQSILQAMNSVP